MPTKRCGLGFDCASMMLQPGIDPGVCLNYKTCGSANELSPEERFELIQIRENRQRENQESYERIRESYWVTCREAATIMLMRRGCPQTVESLGLVSAIAQLINLTNELQNQLTRFEGVYVAPEGVEAHIYNVKRPKGTYQYNKLTADLAIFEPVEKTEKVKVIHLSHNSDARNSVARIGIERRNALTQIRTQLRVAQQALTLATEIIGGSSNLLQPIARTSESSEETESPS